MTDTTTTSTVHPHRTRGWLLAAAGMLLVSTDSLFIRLSHASTWDITFLVAVFSLPVYVGLALRTQRGGLRRHIQIQRRPLILIGLLACTSQVSFIAAVNRTAVANVVTIVAAAPIVAALVGWLIFGERTSSRVWTAIGVTVVGIAVVVVASLGEPTLDGDLLALLAIGTFGFSINIWRRFPEMSVFVGLAMSAGVMLVVAAPFASPFDLPIRAYLSALAMGMVFNPLGRICHSSSPRYAPAAEVALFTPVETVAASIWAWLAFSEAPPTQTVVGALIIIAGVLYGTVFASSI